MANQDKSKFRAKNLFIKNYQATYLRVNSVVDYFHRTDGNDRTYRFP